jgi:glucosamine-6-phosphate deaminase
MLVVIKDTYAEISQVAAQIVANALRKKPALTLGLATGSTPLGLYRELVRLHREEGLDFSGVVTFNLDEYLGLAPTHPQSYHHFMDQHFFNHLDIDRANIHIPDGTITGDYDGYCAAYEARIRQAGGIDLQILGIGTSGHIGFNEPTTSLSSRTRITVLTEQTLRDNQRFFTHSEDPPQYAITMGLGTIMEARRILLLATGNGKAAAVAQAIEGPLTSSVTASVLQLHPDVTAILDTEAAERLAHKDYYGRTVEMTMRFSPRKLF